MATKTPKTEDTLAALGWLEEDANQLRVAGHGSLERETNLVTLRTALDKVDNSRIRPREGQPWPVTAEAGSYEGTEYSQGTARANTIVNDMPVIEGDPNRDEKAVSKQLEAERERAEADGIKPKAKSK